MKDEYLTLQKRSMTSLKKCMNKMDRQELGGPLETDGGPEDGRGEFHGSDPDPRDQNIRVLFY